MNDGRGHKDNFGLKNCQFGAQSSEKDNEITSQKKKFLEDLPAGTAGLTSGKTSDNNHETDIKDRGLKFKFLKSFSQSLKFWNLSGTVKKSPAASLSSDFNSQFSSHTKPACEATTSSGVESLTAKFSVIRKLIQHYHIFLQSLPKTETLGDYPLPKSSAKGNSANQNFFINSTSKMTDTTRSSGISLSPSNFLHVPRFKSCKSLSCSNLTRVDSVSSDEGYGRDRFYSSPRSPSPINVARSCSLSSCKSFNLLEVPHMKSRSCLVLMDDVLDDGVIYQKKRSDSSDSAVDLPNEDDGNQCQSSTFQKSQTDRTDVQKSSVISMQILPATMAGNNRQTPSVIISDHSNDEGAACDFGLDYLEDYCTDTGLTLEDIGRQWNLPPRKYSNCSSCSSLSFDEDDCRSDLSDDTPLVSIPTKTSGWRKVRNIVHWSPFVQTYKKQKYPWIQLAGHQGSFKPGDHGTILKKLCPKEEVCLQKLSRDVLRPYIPDYKGQVDGEEGEKYIRLQDLLCDFENPCVMDCKMGVRTYLEEELAKAKEKPKLRKDMYEKMIQIDPNAPTPEEHLVKGITKPRYMVWRETISSTETLGFRIEGMKKADGTSSKDFKTTRTKEQVLAAFRGFLKDHPGTAAHYVQRLKAIRATLEVSEFFAHYELIGSSLLFVHNHQKANVWMIDFAKTLPLPEEIKIDHRSHWIVGSHEDGYLIGLENLTSLFQTLAAEEAAASSQSPGRKESV